MEVFEPFADRLVPDVLDALGIERAHLIATSFGSYFALRAAAASPERVGRMVLVGFPVGAEATDTPLAMRMTAVPGLGPLLTRLPVAERVARTMLRQLGLGAALDAGRLPDEGLSWFRSLLNDTGTMRNELAAMPPVMDPRHGLSPDLVLGADLLGSIAVPTLLLWGSIDPLGGERVARTFAPRIPGADLEVLPGVGHVPWLDDPDRVAAAVEAFLVARPGGAGKGVPPPWTP
jgi:pimeloyl-ACP methyl ester carboxylesterase